MTHEERMQFSRLLFTHKHLLTLFQEYRYMTEHPEADFEAVHERFFDEVDDVYQTLQNALVEDAPIHDTLDTVITHSELIENEIRNGLKERR